MLAFGPHWHPDDDEKPMNENEHKEIAVASGSAMERAANLEPTALIRLAIEGGKVDVVERLLALRHVLKAEAAQEAFFRDLAAFQAECPTIAKCKVVKDKYGKERYRYAPLEDILAQVGPLLRKYGFSHTEDAEVSPGWVEGTCTAHHAQGHSEVSTFKVPIDPEAYMNEAQKYASALTFAKRYAFLARFGILTGDEDDDSQASGEPGKKPEPTSKVASQPSQTAPAPTIRRIKIDGPPLKDLSSLLAGFQERCKAKLVEKAQSDPQSLPYWQRYAVSKGWILPNEGIQAILGNQTEVFALDRTKDVQANSAAVLKQFEGFILDVQALRDFVGANPEAASGPIEVEGNEVSIGGATDAAAQGCPNCGAKTVIMSKEFVDVLECQACAWQWDMETGNYYEEHEWQKAVCPIPPKGTLKKDYNPQTLGQIARTDSKRFYGLVMNNQEAKGWTGRDGKQRPPSREDMAFAQACKAAVLHMEQQKHRDVPN